MTTEKSKILLYSFFLHYFNGLIKSFPRAGQSKTLA